MNRKMKEACAAVADVFEALPECWTYDVQARDEHGNELDGDATMAVQWCVVGGLMAAMEVSDGMPIAISLQSIAEKLGYRHAAAANNEGGREVAINMLRMAAES